MPMTIATTIRIVPMLATIPAATIAEDPDVDRIKVVAVDPDVDRIKVGVLDPGEGVVVI